MSILDLESHAKYISYTMTLAAVGFAYTDAGYDDGRTFFTLETGDWNAASIVVTLALTFFLLTLIFGLFVLSGISGLNQLRPHEDELESEIGKEKIAQIISVGQKNKNNRSIYESLKKTKEKIKKYNGRIRFYSAWHLICLIVGFSLSALLFIDSKIDPNPLPQKCQLEVDSSGNLVLPVACLPQKQQS